jgi:tetratricopeptide (TPR) repeat protein
VVWRLGEQELLTFEPGKSTVNYILGYVGTREQAETALISARNDITAAQNTLGGINLTYANEFLEQARLALENGNFVDAERFASNSSYLVNKISSDFELAKETIRNANEKIRSFQQMNLDVNQAESLLSQSNIKFATGEYAEAANLASMALESLANKLENGNQFLVPILGVISSIALSGLFIMFYMKKLKSKKRYYDTIGVTPAESISHDNSHNIKKQQNTPYSKTKAETGLDLPISNLDHVTQTDKHLDIRRLVEAKLMAYPNLREEDQKVIYFLADKEGSAFEAEIRTKFVLPKTSLWRLVKRLERLELIEVTKMAGQNLLRLKL